VTHALSPRRYTTKTWENGLTALIEQRYSMLAAAIYPSLFEFRVAVDDALHELSYPDASPRIVRGAPIFSPRPDQRLQPGPHHALDRLMLEVLRHGRDLLQLQATLPMPSRLEWSKHIIKGWHGKASWQDDDCPPPGRIRINKLLDSLDVSEATLCFLLWHEYLHLYLKCLHTPTFRRLERLWPDCPQCERELDTLGERFEITYW
jgi:hypothetical protein